MTLKSALLACAVLLTTSMSFASGAATDLNDTTAQSADEANLDPNGVTFHGYLMWQCSAHSTHNEWNIYQGIPSRDRHQAEHSAVHECEDQEGHECVIHHCHRL